VNSLFSEETLNLINELLRETWNGNRIFDRACSVLKVKFNMYNLENVLHHEYAHYFPVFSDNVVDFLQGYNQSVIYPETIAGTQEYENPIELIIQLRSYFLDFKAMILRISSQLSQDSFIEYELKTFLEQLNLALLEKAQRIVKIENIIIGSLRPDSSKSLIIDLDNSVVW
jgi:hypothetical protein